MTIKKNPFSSNEKIKFPVNFDLKIIMLANNRHADNQAMLEQVFVQLGISFLNWRHKESEKGNYTSYTVHIRVLNEVIMKKLYDQLNTVPGVKMAI